MENIQNNLLILVGLTGSGKTTTVQALRETGLAFHLLPNRRELTDRFIIQYLQGMAGEPVAPVTDRTERFAYTHRYRELHPGGMAEALFRYWAFGNQYSVNGNRTAADCNRLPITDNRLLIFDGLRGANEVTHAIRLFPKARFLFLHATDFVRVQRLVKRQDVFDSVAIGDGVNTAVLWELAEGILTNEELDQLLTQISNGEIDAQELQTKLTIVRSERQNYDPDATLQALQNLATDRLIFGDTVAFSPAEIAKEAHSVLRSGINLCNT